MEYWHGELTNEDLNRTFKSRKYKSEILWKAAHKGKVPNL